MLILLLFFFFFNDTATTEIYTLSLHDALPILAGQHARHGLQGLRVRHHLALVPRPAQHRMLGPNLRGDPARSEEHTSELQSRQYLVCRLLLEKKKNKKYLSTV